MMSVSTEVTVFDGAGVGYWEWNVNSGAVIASPGLRVMLGWPDDHGDRAGLDDVFASVHPEERAGVLATLRQMVANGQERLEQRFGILSPDGSNRHILSHVRQVSEDHQHPLHPDPVRVIGIWIVLPTGEFAAGETLYHPAVTPVLESSHSHHRGLLEAAASEARSLGEVQPIPGSLPFRFARFDENESYRFANAAYAEHHGRTSEGIAGHRIREVLGSEQYSIIRSHLQTMLRDRRVVVYEIHSRDGSSDEPRIVQVTLVPSEEFGDPDRGGVALISDVSRLYRLELALDLSIVRFLELADAIPHLVWVMEADAATAYYNRWVERFDAAIGTPSGNVDWRNVIHPDDRARSSEAWATALASNERYICEHRLRMADGSWRWHLSCAEPARDAAGEKARWYGTATDIDDLKRAERSLDEQVGDLLAIYEGAPLGLATVDRDLRFVRLNAAVAEMTGVPLESHIGRVVWDIMPDLKEAAEPMFRRVFQSGEGYAGIAYAGETPQFPGVTRHWEIDFYPIRATAEDVRQVAVIVNEITDRYKAEVALRESEERFREMANNAPVIVWVSDRSGGTTFLGKTWFTLTGQSESQALGFGWLGVVHPEDRDNVEEEFRAANAREEAYRSEYRLRQVSGDYRWVLNSANPRIAPDGAFLGYIGSLLDITERREAEELHDLLSSEAVHRAKNTMALVQAVVRQTRADNVESLRSAIQGRVAAIASAQSLLAESGGESINLLRLLERQTLVYDNDRVVLTGDRAVVLNDEAAQPFALAIHELVTNSIKYGALSVSTGRLELSWEVAPDRNLTLRWRELGGPQLKIPMRRSFGTMLIAATIERQLGGTIRYDWRAEGLTCEIAIPYSLLDPNPAAQPRPDNGSDGNA